MPNLASASPPSAGPIVTRRVELDGVQRDGVGHVFLFDQGGDEGRIGRAAEGLGAGR